MAKKAKAPKEWLVYAERATQYARDVVSGKIHACRWVRYACQRHLDDLVKSQSDDFPYRFDPAKAGKVCKFIERFPHVKGQWAIERENIRLEPWQLFIVCSIFGWLFKSTGFRRFIEAFILVPRKNGKTVLAAGIGLYMFVGDGEPGAEVYTGASNKNQSKEVFSPASKMAKRAEDFKAYFDIEIGKESMYIPDEGSKFEIVIGNPGDGPSPHCFIHDEFHQHPTPAQYDTAKSGMMARRQPLQLTISTAGIDSESPCHMLQKDCEKVLEGKVTNDRLFTIIYTVDDPEKWASMEAVMEANPNFGVSVLPENIASALQDAIQKSGKQNSFKAKNLNIWVNATTAWMSSESWKKCADPSLKIDDFVRDVCFEGDDLAAKLDLASRMKVFVRDIEGKRHYYLFGRHYVPQDRAMDGDHQHYEDWVHNGHLVAHEGPEIVLSKIQKEIEDDLGEFKNIENLAFDPWSALQMQQELEKKTRDGVVISIPQKTQFLSPAMREIEAAVEAGRLHHTGDPVLAWAIGNVLVKEDARQNIFPRKDPNGVNKIDPATALINAISRAHVYTGPTRSVYEERGILIL